MNSRLHEVSRGIFMLCILVGAPLLLIFTSTEAQNRTNVVASTDVTCKTEKVPFETVTQRDETRYIGEPDVVAAEGVDGERKICSRSNGYVVSDDITVQPVAKQVSVASKEKPPAPPIPTYTPRYRTGAECHDGSYSSATGRGACSWHGGVYQWLYE